MSKKIKMKPAAVKLTDREFTDAKHGKAYNTLLKNIRERRKTHI